MKRKFGKSSNVFFIDGFVYVSVYTCIVKKREVFHWKIASWRNLLCVVYVYIYMRGEI